MARQADNTANEAVPIGHTPKLHPPFKGPYTIISCGPNYTYLLEDVNGKRLPHAINGRRLKPFNPRNVPPENVPAEEAPPQPPATQDDDQLEGVAQLLKDTASQEPQASTSGGQHTSTLTANSQEVAQHTAEEQSALQGAAVGTSTGNTGEKLPASQQAINPPKGNNTIQPDMVEDIIKITNSKGIKYFRVKLKNGLGRAWVFRESVPDNLVHNFYKGKTMTGRTRKRGGKCLLVPAV